MAVQCVFGFMYMIVLLHPLYYSAKVPDAVRPLGKNG